jgi:hypothetical protein
MWHTSKSLIENEYVDVERYAEDLRTALDQYYGPKTFNLDEDVSIAGCEKILSMLSKQKLVELGLVDVEAVLRDYRWEQSTLEEDLVDEQRHREADDFSRTPERDPLV